MNCPAGKNWVSVDGEYKAITVSGKVTCVVVHRAKISCLGSGHN